DRHATLLPHTHASVFHLRAHSLLEIASDRGSRAGNNNRLRSSFAQDSFLKPSARHLSDDFLRATAPGLVSAPGLRGDASAAAPLASAAASTSAASDDEAPPKA
ncbi:unnamed protein product, partial [Ectocarpus sp. 8 AP-2014]